MCLIFVLQWRLLKRTKHLEERLRAGEIVRYRFEAVKFHLAELAYYTPHFGVQLPHGTLEFHKVKPGYRQKLKDGTRREGPVLFRRREVEDSHRRCPVRRIPVRYCLPSESWRLGKG